jgi:zinc and cadmium transporter
MFILEKLVHYHHSKKHEHDEVGHSHAYSIAPVNLIGDAVHNFIDGMVIAGAYTVNFSVGIASTLSVLFHELPQEIADFGVLLYSGLSKKKALLFNFMSALTAVLGAILGIVLAGSMHSFTDFILPFAAGNFLYIAASNLLPELHRHCRLKDTLFHVLAILLGIILILLVTLYGPAHVHG